LTTLVAAVVASSTVVYNATTGFIKITFGSGTHKITFTDAALKTLLGFGAVDTTTSAAASFTATREPQYVWSPNRGIVDVPVDPARIVQPISSTRVQVSRDGTLTTVRGNLRYAGDVEYRLLDGARVFTPATGSVNGDFESFFEDVIHAGELIRLYPDRTVNTSTDFVTVKVVAPGGEEIGAFESFARRHIQSYQGLADVQIPVAKYVA
jgi:hypothetical protein